MTPTPSALSPVKAAGIALLLVILTAGASRGQQFEIEPRLSCSWESSDNIFLDPDNGAASATNSSRQPVADSMTVVTPGISLEARGRRAGVAMRYDAGLASYASNDDLDTWRHEFRFDGKAAVSSRTTVTLRNSFLRTEDPNRLASDAASPDDLGQAPDTDPGILPARRPYTLSTTAAGIQFEPGNSNSVAAAYEYGRRREKSGTSDSYTRNRGSAKSVWHFRSDWFGKADAAYESADFDESNDLDLWDASVEIGREMGGGLVCFGKYTHVRLETADADSDVPEPGVSYTVADPEVGVVYTGKRGGIARLSAGYFFRSADDGNDTSGFSGTLNIARQSGRSVFSVLASAGHDEQIYARERSDSSTFSEVGSRVSFSATDLIRLGAQASYRRDKYDNPPALDGGDGDWEADADGYAFNFWIDYKPREWVTARLSYGYTDRFSREEDDNYVENRVSAVVTVGYP